jgi:hypothetical protein
LAIQHPASWSMCVAWSASSPMKEM